MSYGEPRIYEPDDVNFIMRYEAGECESEEEVVEGYQRLIDSGMVWHLQGSHGRRAADFISQGLCHVKTPNDEPEAQ